MERKKLARAFHRMLTGLQIAQNNSAFMRFMTLTSIKFPRYELKDGFDVLRKRIMRARFERDGFHGFKFNRYFCIRTSEGNGVLHIVFWGKYIPQDWLRRQWMDINGAFKVDIRACTSRRGRVDGLVGYLLTNYLTEQPIERMSYGWKWAWLGFCKSWTKTKQMYGMMRKGTGELTTRIIHRAAQSAFYGINHTIKGGEMFFQHSKEAWRCTLWLIPLTSRQLKMKGSPIQKYWDIDFDRTELDLPVKKKPEAKRYRSIEGEVSEMLNARSALFKHGFDTF